MVDLMMWLVIAALLLTAALQGVSYYKTAAIHYLLKNDADSVRSYMNAKHAKNNKYPEVAEMLSDAEKGELTFSSTNRIAGIAVDGNTWAVRICSPDLKSILNNAPGTSVRFTSTRPNEYDFRVCEQSDEPDATYTN